MGVCRGFPFGSRSGARFTESGKQQTQRASQLVCCLAGRGSQERCSSVAPPRWTSGKGVRRGADLGSIPAFAIDHF